MGQTNCTHMHLGTPSASPSSCRRATPPGTFTRTLVCAPSRAVLTSADLGRYTLCDLRVSRRKGTRVVVRGEGGGVVRRKGGRRREREGDREVRRAVRKGRRGEGGGRVGRRGVRRWVVKRVGRSVVVDEWRGRGRRRVVRGGRRAGDGLARNEGRSDEMVDDAMLVVVVRRVARVDCISGNV